ncbi:MAG: galactose mutarotase [Prevotella sp.]|nr:galactose mutarotase [Prevotella sp.]
MKSLRKTMLGASAITALAFAACTGSQQPTAQLTASGLDPVKFETVVGSDSVKLYTLKGDNGMEVCITNFGGRVVSLMVPDKDGNLVDVVLGFDNIDQYMEKTTDYGSSVGRYANRINMGRFVLDGDTIQLKQNDKHDGGRDHCLHGGGDTGWMNQVYKAEQIDSATLKLTIKAQDGENGFPGTIEAVTTYKIVDGNTLDITWEATTDKPTVINQTNHNYYNLSGDLEHAGYDQVLYVNADSFTESDESYMPTGVILPVEGTPMDFRTPHAVGDSIKSEYYQIKNAHGYDHNWCLNTYKDGKGDDTQVCASLYSPKTGIFMEMYTNEPGVQVYSGNFQGVNGEENVVRKLGKKYPQHVSICLESQKYPDSPNHPEWASPVLRPGENYFSHAAYKFTTK